jgi:hypothetical protein
MPKFARFAVTVDVVSVVTSSVVLGEVLLSIAQRSPHRANWP